MKHKSIAAIAAGASVTAALAFMAAAQFSDSASPAPASANTVTRAEMAGMVQKFEARSFDVLVATRSHDYETVIRDIEQAGGTVTRQFKYAKGLAASIPFAALKTLRHNPDVLHVEKDAERFPAGNGNKGKREVSNERVAMGKWTLDDMDKLESLIRSGAAFDAESLHPYKAKDKITLNREQIDAMVSDISPDTYANAVTMNAPAVWSSGNMGQDSIVAVIDSGVFGDHFMLEGSLVGCDDLSSDAGTPACDSPENGYHGTHVASTIAGHGAILVAANDPLAGAIARYMAPLPQASSIGYPGARVLPLLGMAPAAQIYGVKVFPAAGGGAPTSTIIGAIEHVIDLRVEDGWDIDVINMSLGGGTTYDVYDLESMAVDAATAAGITVVTSNGNDGPASQTVGSPAGAYTAIATGAIADPVHMRVFWDLNFGKPGIGHQTFVSDYPQPAYFSSRGPTSGGGPKPALSANGVFVLAADTPDGIAFSSGTSMASPGIAGTVALLNTWSENNGDAASPYDYREALMAGAVPVPYFEDFEQGAGYNNAANALQALMADGSLGDSYPPLPPAPAAPALPAGMDLGIVGAGSASFSIDNLKPGEVRHYYFEVTPETSSIVVDASSPRSRRDPYLLNSFEFHLSTGDRTYTDYYFTSGNIWNKAGPARFEVMDRSSVALGNATGHGADPMLIQPGYTRLSVENDWTSAGPISGNFEVTVSDDPRPGPDYGESDVIATGETHEVAPLFPCPEAMCWANLRWQNDWTAYPTSDLDLIAYGVDLDAGAITYIDFRGASLRSPETTSVDRSDPGWTLGDPSGVDAMLYDVDGYDTHGGNEPFQFEWFQAETP